MRKISITPEIEQMVDKKYKDALHASDIHQRIISDLTTLRQEFLAARSVEINTGSSKNPIWEASPSNALQYAEYIREILRDYQTGVLLTWQPTMFLGNINHKDTFVHHQIVNCAMRVDGQDRESFANRLVKAMCYDDVRKAIVPPIYRKLELKSCVYCNANYTISDENGEGYYDLDHWKPKSFYPFLCISFFNLQPSCTSCNRRKSASDLEFMGLWDDTGSRDLDVLKFKLEERSLVNYLAFLEREGLKIQLIEADPWNPLQQTIRNNTEQRLHIEARYAEHRDYAEEIVWKSKIYNPSMIQSLRDSKFGALIPNQVDWERFILGTYADPDDIYKRPLTRLAIDVAKQLGFIL
jgi:hypothetical protein